MARNYRLIPQIPDFSFKSLQNDLHIGFVGDVAIRLKNARWTDEAHTTKRYPEDVDQLMSAFIQLQAAEDACYVVSQGSDLTRQRVDADTRRDAVFKEVRKTVAAFTTLSIFPEKQQAARLLLPVMQKYGIQPDGGIEAQTVATGQWLQEQMEDRQLEQAARTLGIQQSLEQLKQLNDEVRQLTADRNDERSQRADSELKKARKAVDQAFHNLALMVNAQAIVHADDNTIYTDLIAAIHETIRYYRQIADERRRQNKRVIVSSDLLGRKYYATVSGWTWQRLIRAGKARLAVSDDHPDRIHSTDRKALRAGGLLLALNGQPVKPTDYVDTAQTYELVSANNEWSE